MHSSYITRLCISPFLWADKVNTHSFPYLWDHKITSSILSVRWQDHVYSPSCVITPRSHIKLSACIMNIFHISIHKYINMITIDINNRSLTIIGCQWCSTDCCCTVLFIQLGKTITWSYVCITFLSYWDSSKSFWFVFSY